MPATEQNQTKNKNMIAQPYYERMRAERRRQLEHLSRTAIAMGEPQVMYNGDNEKMTNVAHRNISNELRESESREFVASRNDHSADGSEDSH